MRQGVIRSACEKLLVFHDRQARCFSQRVTSLRFSPCGRWVAGVGWGGILSLFLGTANSDTRGIVSSSASCHAVSEGNTSTETSAKSTAAEQSSNCGSGCRSAPKASSETRSAAALDRSATATAPSLLPDRSPAADHLHLVLPVSDGGSTLPALSKRPLPQWRIFPLRETDGPQGGSTIQAATRGHSSAFVDDMSKECFSSHDVRGSCERFEAGEYVHLPEVIARCVCCTVGASSWRLAAVVDEAAAVEALRPESAPPSLLAWVQPAICKPSGPAAVGVAAQHVEPMQPSASSSSACGVVHSNASCGQSGDPFDPTSKPGVGAACNRPTTSNTREAAGAADGACVGRDEALQVASAANGSVQPDGRQQCVVTRHSNGATATYSIVVNAEASPMPSNRCTEAAVCICS